jgi:hypothetical protein
MLASILTSDAANEKSEYDGKPLIVTRTSAVMA